MTELIHDHLVREGEELAHRARAYLTGHLHHHNHQEEPAVNITDDIKTDLSDGLSYVEGWVARVKQAVPGILSDAQKFANSPILKALEAAGALIDAPAESVIAGWITDLAGLKAGTSAPAGADAEPPPAA